MIRVESGGRALVGGRPIVSSAGAMGLMQLMPGTWRDMRLLLGLGSDPQDPRDNILAGSAYLRLMYDRFGYPGLFAAYHAGPARYAGVLSGDRPLPAATRAYLAAIAGPAPRRPAAPRPGGALFALPVRAMPVPRSQPPQPSQSETGLFAPLSGSAPRP